MLTTIVLSMLLLADAQQRVEPEFPARLGNRAPPFSLYDAAGRARHLSEFEGHAGLVVVFMKAEQAAAQRRTLTRLACAYAKRDVVFLAVDVTEYVPRARLARQYAAAALDMPLLFDEEGTVARRYEIRGTPTVFLLDKISVIHYRGELGKALRRALDEMLAKRP